MPSSQLKRLKASLRAEGIVGPQKSKKQKKNSLTNGANKEQKVKRNVALQNIREAFNPFEVQAPSRGKEKFDVTNNRTIGGRVTKGVKGRPGITKGLGEETVRRPLAFRLYFTNGYSCSETYRGRERSSLRCTGETRWAVSWTVASERMTPP